MELKGGITTLFFFFFFALIAELPTNSRSTCGIIIPEEEKRIYVNNEIENESCVFHRNGSEKCTTHDSLVTHTFDNFHQLHPCLINIKACYDISILVIHISKSRVKIYPKFYTVLLSLIFLFRRIPGANRRSSRLEEELKRDDDSRESIVFRHHELPLCKRDLKRKASRY